VVLSEFLIQVYWRVLKKIISEEIEKRKQKRYFPYAEINVSKQRRLFNLLLIHKEQDEGMAHSMPEDMGGLLLGVDVC